MARNWLRTCSLTLSGASTKTVRGGGPTDLRIVFKIEQSTIQSPNPARFRVYNPSLDTVSKLRAKEWTKVSFSAGYEDHSGIVYTGDLKQAITGHETVVDSYVDLFCAGGDAAYNRAQVNKTLAAGWTPKDKLQVALDAMKPFGVVTGLMNVDLSTPKFPRGIPLLGMARDIVRVIAQSKGATWSIQNGDRLNMIDHSQPIGGSPVVLNSKTGMIGWPQQTPNGIIVRSLINSSLQPDTLVQINQSSIQQAARDINPLTEGNSDQNFNLDNTGVIAVDGLYHILAIERSGDTRGQDWYDECTCLASSASPNKAQIAAGLGGPPVIQGGEPVQGIAGQVNLGQGGIGHA